MLSLLVMRKNLTDLLKITSFPILFASLCCLAPVVLVLLGLSTLSFGAALAANLDGKFKPLFLGGGTLLLIASLIIYFRSVGICTLDQAKRRRNEITNKVLLVILFSVVGYILFFNVFLGLVGSWLGLWRGISFAP